MKNKATFQPTADEAAQLEEAIEALLLGIRQANEQMARDQERLDRLQAQTRTLLLEASLRF